MLKTGVHGGLANWRVSSSSWGGGETRSRRSILRRANCAGPGVNVWDNLARVRDVSLLALIARRLAIAPESKVGCQQVWALVFGKKGGMGCRPTSLPGMTRRRIECGFSSSVPREW